MALSAHRLNSPNLILTLTDILFLTEIQTMTMIRTLTVIMTLMLLRLRAYNFTISALHPHTASDLPQPWATKPHTQRRPRHTMMTMFGVRLLRLSTALANNARIECVLRVSIRVR